MQSINPDPTEEEREQIRRIQQYINAGDLKGLKGYVTDMRGVYEPPEYLKQQLTQRQE